MQKIKTLSDFLEKIKDMLWNEDRGIWVYRGHADNSFKLIPSIGRDRKLAEREKEIFKMFKRESSSYLETPLSNDLDILALAQHHSLPTRLLDFSYNPLVALYFAVYEYPDNDGEVIALKIGKDKKAKNEDNPFKVKEPLKYYPTTVTPRIKAQEGLFIICPEPTNNLFPNGDLKIEKFNINKEFKKKLTYELYRLGVHKSLLFPDIDGLSHRIKYQHTVFSKDFVTIQHSSKHSNKTP